MEKNKGFTQAEAENHKDLKEQQENALNLLDNLLSVRNAKHYREGISELFCCFLKTENADYKPYRENLMYLHYDLMEFFTKLDCLPVIDRYRNKS